MKTYWYIGAAIIVGYIVYRIIRYSMARAESPFRYFTWSEFDQPNLAGSGARYMSADFIHKLDSIREDVGFPMVISSGYRSPEHNAQVGGVANSSHIKGLAADIIAPTDDMKYEIAQSAIRNGITRIGWGNSFIHLDVDKDKTQQVVWGYGNDYPNYYELEVLA